jgi:DNA-binding response OmpR family regulator
MIRRQLIESRAGYKSRIFIVCDQSDTAPVWDFILRQRGLHVTLESSLENLMERWSADIPDVVVIDTDLSQEKNRELCLKFREISLAPLLLFLPAHHEKHIIDAYAAGVDEVVVKPISPAIFLAKITAWARRSWTVPVEGLRLVQAGEYRLDPARRCLIDPGGQKYRLTNLEFRLLLLLMSRPGHVFPVEEIIQSIWGVYDHGDQVLLKNVVYCLRRKIEVDPGNPLLLQTRPGGYSFFG